METDEDGNEIIGNVSCVTRFIKSLIMLMEHGARAHLRHLSEFFGLLYEFSRMGEEEALFLLRINVIRSVADFYLGHKAQDCVSYLRRDLGWFRVICKQIIYFSRSTPTPTTRTTRRMRLLRWTKADRLRWIK